MAFPIIPRLHSGSAGYPSALNLGELAVNTFDGSLYLGADSGVAKINAVGVVGSTITEWTATEGQTVFTGINGYVDTADGSYLVSVGGVDQPGSAYAITSANSGTLTLASGAPAGVIVAVRAFVGGTGGGGGSTNATQLQGRAVSSATPNDADSLVWSDANQDWEPAPVNATKLKGTPIQMWTPDNGMALCWLNDHWQPNFADAGSLLGKQISTSQPNDGEVIYWSTYQNLFVFGTPPYATYAASAGSADNASSANQLMTSTGLLFSTNSIVDKINELVTWANNNGASISPF